MKYLSLLPADEVRISPTNSVKILPLERGVVVNVSDAVYSQSVFVPNSDKGRIASVLRAGESLSACEPCEGVIWIAATDDNTGVTLGTAATLQTCHDGPSVFLTPDAAARVAELIDANPDPLSVAKQRMNDNLRKVFG